MSEKPTIVLLPGLDGTGTLFRWLVDAIESQARAVVISYPVDRVLSYRELADLVMQQEPVRPHAIVAESFSGPIAVAVGSRKPAGLEGIVLSTSFVAPPAPRWLRAAPFEALFRFRSPTSLLRRLLLDARCGENVVAEVAGAIAAVSPRVLASRLREVLSTDSSEALRSCAVPVAYIAAAGDRLIGLRGLQSVRRIRPLTEGVTLEGPHLLLQARPREAAGVISGFLQRWLAS